MNWGSLSAEAFEAITTTLSGSNGARRVYVFVDGVAPREADMAPGGLATPLEAMPSFRIP